jgi:hypothetical protein
MAETQRGIYYPTKAVDGNQPAKVIEKMELMAQSIDDAIDNAVQEATYDDTEINKDIETLQDKVEYLEEENTNLKKAMLHINGEGTDITLNNTSYNKMELEIKGNTEQDTLTGKNLLDISKVISSTNDNLINNGDGTLKVKGYGVSAGSPNNLKTYCPTLQVGDEVIISADTTSSNKFIYLSGTNTSWAFGTTRTITQSDLDSIVLWYGASGGDTNYYTISNIMVRKSSVTDSSYEPYCRTEYLAPHQNFLNK